MSHTTGIKGLKKRGPNKGDPNSGPQRRDPKIWRAFKNLLHHGSFGFWVPWGRDKKKKKTDEDETLKISSLPSEESIPRNL